MQFVVVFIILLLIEIFFVRHDQKMATKEGNEEALPYTDAHFVHPALDCHHKTCCVSSDQRASNYRYVSD